MCDTIEENLRVFRRECVHTGSILQGALLLWKQKEKYLIHAFVEQDATWAELNEINTYHVDLYNELVPESLWSIEKPTVITLPYMSDLARKMNEFERQREKDEDAYQQELWDEGAESYDDVESYDDL